MQGYEVLWLPGMDHAGIATQNVVERRLAEEGLSRHDLGRETFVERVWQWKAESGGAILGQMRRLGDSVDWSRERFTMDEGLSRAVQTIFKRLYEDELILVVDAGHPFAARGVIPVDEIADVRLILFDRTSSYYDLTNAFFREAGVAPSGPVAGFLEVLAGVGTILPGSGPV